MKNLCPINKFILVEQLQPTRRGLIHIPQETLLKQFYGVIIMHGDKCNKSILPGMVCFVNPHAIRTAIGNKRYIINEYDIIAIRVEKIFRPLGNRVFIRRLNDEEITDSGIVIPGTHDTKDQSLNGIFCISGTNNGKVVETSFLPGSKVCIEKWNIHIIEIDIDGDYYLSVRLKDLAYAIK